METVLTGWADVPELRYDATTQTLTLIYGNGEIRWITAVSRSGFDRLVGKPDSSAKPRANWLGSAWRAWWRSSIVLSGGRYFNFGVLTAGGGDNAIISNGLGRSTA